MSGIKRAKKKQQFEIKREFVGKDDEALIRFHRYLLFVKPAPEAERRGESPAPNPHDSSPRRRS
ncbi:MAG: hypothetical protein ACRD68_10640 [Pyrinomonadaceae bacterium]